MTNIGFERVARVGAQRLPGWRQPQEVVENDSFPAGSGIPAGNFSTRRIFFDCRQRANFLGLRPTGSRSASTGATRDHQLHNVLTGAVVIAFVTMSALGCLCPPLHRSTLQAERASLSVSTCRTSRTRPLASLLRIELLRFLRDRI